MRKPIKQEYKDSFYRSSGLGEHKVQRVSVVTPTHSIHSTNEAGIRRLEEQRIHAVVKVS